MTDKFQHLFNKLIEENDMGNVSSPGGSFGPTNNLVTDPDVRTAMAVTGGGTKKKKKKPLIFKRKFPPTKGL